MEITVDIGIYNADTGKPEWHQVLCQSRETIEADVEQWCMENLECDYDIIKIEVPTPFEIRLSSFSKPKDVNGFPTGQKSSQ